MPPDPSPKDAVGKHESSSETAPSNELSGAVAPKTHEIALEDLSEEAIRSVVSDLLKRCEGRQGDESAASELVALIDAEGIRGKLVRAALIEELLAFEESILRSINGTGSSDWCFRFADHIADFVTVACGKEMTAEQRSSLLHCVESYIDMAGSADSWGAGAVRLLRHAVTVTNDLFLYSTPICLTQPEQASLGATYLRFLSKHDIWLSSPELYSMLKSPVDYMLEALSIFNTPRRGEKLKDLFMHVDKVCQRFVGKKGDVAGEDVRIGRPIELIETLLLDDDLLPIPDAAGAQVETTEGIDNSVEAPTEDEQFAVDATDEYPEGNEFDGDNLEGAEVDYDEFNEAYRDFEQWRGDATDEDPEDLEFLEADSDESDIMYREMEESVQVASDAREMKASLAKALKNCPSLQREAALWERLVFTQPALEPGSMFFAQGYAQTSLKALQSLLVAIPLSMQDETAIAANFVGLLAIESELLARYKVDLPTAYRTALESLKEDEHIIELERDFGDELVEAGFRGIEEFVDTRIHSLLAASLDADWDELQELAEIYMMGNEMRNLVHSFTKRVWDRHDSHDPGSLSD